MKWHINFKHMYHVELCLSKIKLQIIHTFSQWTLFKSTQGGMFILSSPLEFPITKRHSSNLLDEKKIYTNFKLKSTKDDLYFPVKLKAMKGY